jgi:hypothetical protein
MIISGIWKSVKDYLFCLTGLQIPSDRLIQAIRLRLILTSEYEISDKGFYSK